MRVKSRRFGWLTGEVYSVDFNWTRGGEPAWDYQVDLGPRPLNGRFCFAAKDVEPIIAADAAEFERKSKAQGGAS